MKKLIFVMLLVVVLSIGLWQWRAHQQEPVTTALTCSNIEVLVGFGAGGGTDIYVRHLKPGMEKMLNKPVKINNVPGGGGALAFKTLLQRPADGCTVLALPTDYVVLEATGTANVSLDQLQLLLRSQLDVGFLFSNIHSADRVDALYTEVKNQQRPLRIGGTGANSFDEAVVHVLMQSADMDYTYIPYDGAKDMHADLLGGRLDLMYEESGVVKDLLESERIKPLVVAWESRVHDWPDVPTAKELGWQLPPPQFRGLAMRAETSETALKLISDAAHQAMQEPSYKKYVETHGLTIVPGYADGKTFSTDANKQIALFRDIMSTD